MKTKSLEDAAAAVSDVSRRLMRRGGADCGINFGLTETAFSACAVNSSQEMNETWLTRLQSTWVGDDCNDVEKLVDRQSMTFRATEVSSRIFEIKAFLSWSVTRTDMIEFGS